MQSAVPDLGTFYAQMEFFPSYNEQMKWETRQAAWISQGFSLVRLWSLSFVGVDCAFLSNFHVSVRSSLWSRLWLAFRVHFLNTCGFLLQACIKKPNTFKNVECLQLKPARGIALKWDSLTAWSWKMESVLSCNSLKSLQDCFSPRYLTFQASEIGCKSYRLLLHLAAPVTSEFLNFVEVSAENLMGWGY